MCLERLGQNKSWGLSRPLSGQRLDMSSSQLPFAIDSPTSIVVAVSISLPRLFPLFLPGSISTPVLFTTVMVRDKGNCLVGCSGCPWLPSRGPPTNTTHLCDTQKRLSPPRTLQQSADSRFSMILGGLDGGYGSTVPCMGRIHTRGSLKSAPAL